MKKQGLSILFNFRIIFFIIHLLMVFAIISNIRRIGLFANLFLFLDVLFSLKILMELLSSKKRYRVDIAYNAMQIVFFAYITLLWWKIIVQDLFVYEETIVYFRNNYLFLSILVFFLIIYGLFLLKPKK